MFGNMVNFGRITKYLTVVRSDISVSGSRHRQGYDHWTLVSVSFAKRAAYALNTLPPRLRGGHKQGGVNLRHI